MNDKKAELVAHVFAAPELGIFVCLSTVQRTSKIENQKLNLLKTPGGLLPNPLLPKDGWIKETESMQSWPPIFLSNITVFVN